MEIIFSKHPSQKYEAAYKGFGSGRHRSQVCESLPDGCEKNNNLSVFKKENNNIMKRPAKDVNFGGSSDIKKDIKNNPFKDPELRKEYLWYSVGAGAAFWSLMFGIPFGLKKMHSGISKMYNKMDNPSKMIKGAYERYSKVHNWWLGPEDKAASNAKVPEWAKKVVKNSTFLKAINYAYKNESLFEAVIALGLGFFLKPIATLLMPGADMEDKKVSAVKNIAGAITSWGIATLIFKPIGEGCKEFTSNISKYSKSGYLNDIKSKAGKETLKRVKTYFKYGPQIVAASVKSAITFAILPYVLKLIFGDKKVKKANDSENKFNWPLISGRFKNDLFLEFSGKGGKLCN